MDNDTESRHERRSAHPALTRRDFTRLGLALGVSAAAMPAFLQGFTPSAAARAQDVAADAPKPAELKVLYVGVEANVDSMNFAAEKYAAEKGIKVIVDSFPQTAMREKLFAELSSQSPYYDVVLIDHPWARPRRPTSRSAATDGQRRDHRSGGAGDRRFRPADVGPGGL